MTRTQKVVGKLSLWGIVLMFLAWLAKQLLAWFLAIITPWVNWLLSWLMLIAVVAVVIGLLVGGTLAFFAYRSWRKRREEKKKNDEKA